jgi:hypothetical protein
MTVVGQKTHRGEQSAPIRASGRTELNFGWSAAWGQAAAPKNQADAWFRPIAEIRFIQLSNSGAISQREPSISSQAAVSGPFLPARQRLLLRDNLNYHPDP